jgi:hypothetical protein
MTITGTTARNYFEKKYGKNLPYDLNGFDNSWNEQELELAKKYLGGESFQDFTGIELLIYVEEYIDNFLNKFSNIKYSNLSKEMLYDIIKTLNSLFNEEILKQINYILLTLVIDYKIIYDSKLPDVSFDNYVIEKLRLNGNHKEWLGS